MRRVNQALTRALERSSADILGYLAARRPRRCTRPARRNHGGGLATCLRAAQDPERARMWLFGIARGTLQNHARSQRRRWELADRIRSQVRIDATAPAADEGAEVRDAIERLEPDLAELVRLVHWDRLSIVDAAELLGIPASTARGRYQRAKEQLRAALSIAAPLA